MNERIKVFTISDHPLLPSGVAHTMKNIIISLLESDKFDVYSYGGAIKHPNYDPIATEEWGERWVIQPVDGFGTQEGLRSTLRSLRPDILIYQSDPRFYDWMHEMEHEIRAMVPTVWYGIWDNYPYPKFNDAVWGSVDQFVSISKVTKDLVDNVVPDTKNVYIPHSVDENVFNKLESTHRESFIREHFPQWNKDKFVVFWNNRNARRKLSGSLIFWFKDFLDRVGSDKATLIMHTDPTDPHGQDLPMILRDLDLEDGQVILSHGKIDQPQLNKLYNLADVTVNISDAEGFGLSTLESLSAETPIIVNMTGGLQEQVTDGKEWFGIGIEPAAKAIVGTQQIPYIYEDRISGEDFVDALEKMYNMSPDERAELGKKGKKHVEKNYGFDNFKKSWVDLMLKTHEEFGSWPNKKYKSWELMEL